MEYFSLAHAIRHCSRYSSAHSPFVLNTAEELQQVFQSGRLGAIEGAADERYKTTEAAREKSTKS